MGGIKGIIFSFDVITILEFRKTPFHVLKIIFSIKCKQFSKNMCLFKHFEAFEAFSQKENIIYGLI